jgi:hypothetical protein
MSLLRKNSLELGNIKYVLFKYIPYKVNLRVPKKFIKKEIYNYDEITIEMKNNYVNNILNIYINDSIKNESIIDKYLNISNNKELIIKELNQNTFFENDIWNITNLSRKYNITGKEVFFSFISNSNPFRMGNFDYTPENNNLDNIEKYWEEHSDKTNVYVDYYNGIGVKNSFPVDIYKSHFTLNIRRYNDRNSFNNNGYFKILDILNQKIEKVKNGELVLQEFERYNEILPDEEINLKVDKNNEFNKIPFEVSETVKQGYFNHRFNNKNVWDFMLFPTEETLINETVYSSLGDYKNYIMDGINKNMFDLENYFTLINNKLVVDDTVKLENLSVVNCLIFGKTRIRLEDINVLMGLIRYKNEYYKVRYLDNYIIDFDKKYFKNNVYFITINDDDNKLNELDFYNDDETKYKIVENIVHLMNEVKPELLNHHNYNILVKYLRNNIYQERYLWNLVPNEKERIRRTTFN